MLYSKTALSILAALVAASEGGVLTTRQDPPSCLDNLPSSTLGNGDDAKACVAQLANRGEQACNAVGIRTTLCQQGRTAITVLNAKLNSVGGSDAGNTAKSCVGVAQAAGRIFDSCFRGDNTVRGQIHAADNANVVVDIRAV